MFVWLEKLKDVLIKFIVGFGVLNEIICGVVSELEEEDDDGEEDVELIFSCFVGFLGINMNLDLDLEF